MQGWAAHTSSSLPRLERELHEACVRRSPGLVTGGMWPGQSLLTVRLNTTPFRFAEVGCGEPGVVPGRRSQPEAGRGHQGALALTRVPSRLATTPFYTLPEHGQLATQLRFSAESPAGKLFHGTQEASALGLA